MASRYAIYYAPAPSSRWWRFGSRWLGRDAVSGDPRPQFEVPGIAAEALWQLTAQPRRYGFHATLKPPFTLSPGMDVQELYRCVEELARHQRPFLLERLGVRSLGGFLALMPEREPGELVALASECVEQLDVFRAPATQTELSRRREGQLSLRQEALLSRWGYPHVMEQWRFHMTLTGPVEHPEQRLLSAWLEKKLQDLSRDCLEVDGLCVFEQRTREAAFRLTHRFSFGGKEAASDTGQRCGRLFYIAGPSGAGKDSLIAYARARLTSPTTAFARRCITRPQQDGGEAHRAVSENEFDALVRQGAFSLHWRSHGCRYGISAEIDDWLAQGVDVVVNGSREYLPRARTRYPDLRVIWIDASSRTLQNRLAKRAREDASAIDRRMQRAGRYVAPPDAILICNDGLLHEAGDRLLDILSPSRLADSAAARGAIASTPL